VWIFTRQSEYCTLSLSEVTTRSTTSRYAVCSLHDTHYLTNVR